MMWLDECLNTSVKIIILIFNLQASQVANTQFKSSLIVSWKVGYSACEDIWFLNNVKLFIELYQNYISSNSIIMLSPQEQTATQQ